MIRIEQEPDRVPRGLIRLSALALAIALIASVGATLYLGRRHLRELTRVESSAPRNIETRPFELPTEAEQLARDAQARLRSYGWVDRDRGLVHVPLDVAIELYLQEPR